MSRSQENALRLVAEGKRCVAAARKDIDIAWRIIIRADEVANDNSRAS